MIPKTNQKPGVFRQLIRAMKVLSMKDRQKMAIVTFLQMMMSILDVIAVGAIGLLGALTVTGMSSSSSTSSVTKVLSVVKLSNFTLQKQIIILGVCSIILLIVRTALSIFFTRRTIFFLSRRGAIISSGLISRLLSQPLLKLQEKSFQEILWSVTNGVVVVMLHVIATFITLICDVFLLFIIWIGLFALDFGTAIIMLVVFSIVGFSLYQFMHVRAGILGTKNSSLNIKSNEKILEVLTSYRESIVGNRRSYYAREITQHRLELADNDAEINFQPYISKYVMESVLVLGLLLIGGSQIFTQDVSQAASTIAIFLAAATRIAPAVLRVQQGLITIRGALGQATPTLDLLDSLENSALPESETHTFNSNHLGFVPNIILEEVFVKYPNQIRTAISDVSISIDEGSLVALVGPSGAGKTTLVDVLLGILKPEYGKVLISGITPLEVFEKWPGAVAYVPQDVFVISGSIKQNISIGYPPSEVSDEMIWRAIKLANLENFVSGLTHGIDSHVGERGTKLSGGEKQRLGIARALFTCPRLLVLDEATSALDGEAESKISEAINSLRGSMTVVLIAHRLSTVKRADLVVYIEKGEVRAQGTFEEVRLQVPDFDNQVKLMSF